MCRFAQERYNSLIRMRDYSSSKLYRYFGLLGDHQAVQKPLEYVDRFKGDPVAVAVCRILNDFRPLERIVDSLWCEATVDHQTMYLCVALARHCHVAGV